ncbi:MULTISPECIES: LacI family DNA-binding transcriptional regulator [unclassified Paenibacillus]|uniref:LacI family DNA-binding transcriptional regulator n=2 Tax=Paenibacillus TaxID=44249 RepID=UPI00061F286D|nr:MULTISPECIES: LacI family DNA-binding transcriptional regulator [unclassified Paenibacillus]KKC45949.1 hypothetical protein VE23_00595 [Paenibacillus sp. D9]
MSRGKKITMQQIADRLQVSKYTVSQSLSGKSGVSEATRQKVLDTAKAMGYSPPEARLSRSAPRAAESPGTAAGIQAIVDGGEQRATDAPGHERFVVIWMSRGHLEEPMYWQRVLSGIQEGCRSRGWGTVVLSPMGEGRQEDILPPYLNRSLCVGGLAVGAFPLRHLTAMKRTGIPVVLVDHQEPFSGLDSVANDNIAAARMIAGALLDHGCRRFIFVGSEKFSVSFRERWLGCRSALEQMFSLRKAGELRRWNVPYSREWEGDLDARLGRLKEEDLPDAFLCANDDIAIALLSMLRARGVAVPDRCRVAGIDNIEGSTRSQPPLTTVDLGKEVLGQRAVEALERRIKMPHSSVERVGLVPGLVLRSSV